jgi:alginate O-acetyltransferase complex protein AlgI
MLFNSIEFVFVFLPVAIALYSLAARAGRRFALNTLSAMSVIFYSVWLPYHFIVLFLSICFNFVVARELVRSRGRLPLFFGIAVNVAILGYFKYSTFLMENLDRLFGENVQEYVAIVIPLALSFHTFQQIAFLVDCRDGKTQSESFRDYFFFVMFFPQLISGPITHYQDISPQIARLGVITAANFSVGLSLFLIGLFKKLVFADNAKPVADHLFSSTFAGNLPGLFDAWIGALAYACQIYFDFSAYSDMALGLALIFGVRLPVNFNSPYKATSIIEFWRRWHITLSNFLRDYLYKPLGGNRSPGMHKYLNLLIVMVLGGLWHGAAWTFVLWGFFHGALLIVNHALRNSTTLSVAAQRRWGRIAAVLVTFGTVVVGWVLFRAPDLSTALAVYQAMLGFNGVWGAQLMESGSLLLLALLLAVIFAAPNSQEILGDYRPALHTATPSRPSLVERLAGLPFRWRPTAGWAASMVVVALVCWSYLGGSSKFLYFQF